MQIGLNVVNRIGGKMFKVPEMYRVTKGPLGTNILTGNNGAFVIPKKTLSIFAIASDGLGWEHVSVTVSIPRCPTWEEMCEVKNLFWNEDDCVIQYHPPKKEYVNNHEFCLHLWRKVDYEFPIPDSILVGYK